MNLQKLKEAREIVRSGLDNVEFNMGCFYSIKTCGTAACIAGTVALATLKGQEFIDYKRRAEDFTLGSTPFAVSKFASYLECTNLQAENIAIPCRKNIEAAGLKDPWKAWSQEDAIKWLDYWIAYYEHNS